MSHEPTEEQQPIRFVKPSKVAGYQRSVGKARSSLREDESVGTRLELYFSRSAEPPGADEPIYAFQHVMKTGGTSLRALIYMNLSSTARIEHRLVPKRIKGVEDQGRFYRSVLGEFSPEDRSRLIWMISHTTAHAIPILERPVVGLTIVREPLDRTLSRYWFGSKQKKSTRTLETLRETYDRRAGRKLQGEYANPQSRSLLEPFFDVSDLELPLASVTDVDLWHERITSLCGTTYRLLLNDRLDEDAKALARELGWLYDEVPRMRVNKVRPPVDEVPDDLREQILSRHWLDAELYRRALATHPAAQS